MLENDSPQPAKSMELGLLGRYILREYLKIFFLTLGALVFIYLTIDFFEKIRRFVEHGTTFLPVLGFFALKLPRIIYEMAPLAILFTTVLVIGHFIRTHEITAIKAGGVSLMRVMAPLLGLGVVVGLILVVANWSFIATANRQSNTIRSTLIEKKPQAAYFRQYRVWLRLDRHTLLNVQLIDPSQQAMYGMTLYRLSPDFSLRETLEAKVVRYQDGNWVMINGLRRSFSKEQALQIEEFETRPLDLDRKPEDFQQIMLGERELTYEELRTYRERLSKNGFNTSRYDVELSSRIALPFIGLIMILVGIPSGLRGGARGGVAKGIGICLVIALAYWFVLSVSLALGHGGVLPAFLAAWLPNLTFLALGSYLYLQIKQ